MKLSPLFFSCLVILGSVCESQAAEFTISVRDISRPINMTFPEGFFLAESAAAKQRRDRFLDFFRLNPALKGRFDEILLQDWTSEERYPPIVIGTLGSTTREQGRMSNARWREIRQAVLALTPSSIAKIRTDFRPRIEAGSPVATKTTDELIWFEDQTDPNELVALAHMRSEIEGVPETIFSARKFLYHNGYLVVANVYVDSSSPDALRTIRTYLDALNIVSI
jgi:hypothetical protein